VARKKRGAGGRAQTTDFGKLDDPAELRPLDRPCVGCIFVEREVGSRPVIVREVAGQEAAQVAFAQDEDMILRRPVRGLQLDGYLAQAGFDMTGTSSCSWPNAS